MDSGTFGVEEVSRPRATTFMDPGGSRCRPALSTDQIVSGRTDNDRRCQGGVALRVELRADAYAGTAQVSRLDDATPRRRRGRDVRGLPRLSLVDTPPDRGSHIVHPRNSLVVWQASPAAIVASLGSGGGE